jgi:INO80 complex subunit C
MVGSAAKKYKADHAHAPPLMRPWNTAITALQTQSHKLSDREVAETANCSQSEPIDRNVKSPRSFLPPVNSSTMAPLTTASDEKTHQALLDKLDIYAIPKGFRNPHWKPPQRRNKNVRQIISEATRKEASVIATQNNSGVSTPAVPHTEGIATPLDGSRRPPNIAQAAQSLSTLVLEKNNRAAMASASTGPAATYTNIESAPSFHPSSQRRYCDITGLPAPYTDPKTRLRYHNKEVFGTIRTMPQNISESYLAARGAHTVLK